MGKDKMDEVVENGKKVLEEVYQAGLRGERSFIATAIGVHPITLMAAFTKGAVDREAQKK